MSENGQEDKIVGTFIKPSTFVNDIPKIMELAGPEGVANIRASFVKQIFYNARDTATGNFTAGKIEKTLAKYGDEKISAILQPKQIQQLKN